MLILPAAPSAAVSGKQDDTIVFFRWRGNQAARSYARPANPRTTSQTAVRNALATLSQQWATLSEGERASWTSFASTNLTRDRFGRDVTPTGLNWYIKANSNLIYSGGAAVDTAPTLPAPASLNVTLTSIVSPNQVIVAVQGTPAAGFQLKAQIEILPSPAWTPSISRSRLIAGITNGSYKTVAATPDQEITFTSSIEFSTGQTVAVWITTVRTADGTESTPILLVGVAEAP
jgi:hypothetical protein